MDEKMINKVGVEVQDLLAFVFAPDYQPFRARDLMNLSRDHLITTSFGKEINPNYSVRTSG